MEGVSTPREILIHRNVYTFSVFITDRTSDPSYLLGRKGEKERRRDKEKREERKEGRKEGKGGGTEGRRKEGRKEE